MSHTEEYGYTNEGAVSEGVKGDNIGTSSLVSGGMKGKAPMVIAPFNEEDLQPSYAHQLRAPSTGWYGSFMHGLGECIGTLGAIPCCFCCPNPYKSVRQGEVGLVTRFGKFYKSTDPGLTKVNPLSEKMMPVEIRMQVMDIPRQTCMTKDNVNIELSSVMYYHIVKPHSAVFGVDDLGRALRDRTQTTLRQVVGARSLQDIIERRTEIAQSIREIIDNTAASWGTKVESILIKDIILNDELQKSLSMAAQSKRIGESKIITARAEVESAKLMRKAADILASKAAMQIRYLEAMQQMAKSSNSKVIFMPSQGALENLAGEVNSSSFQAATHGAEAQGGLTANEEENQIASNIAYQEI
ncbi:hypothetical protein TRVA0_031S01354 [Trichomonascus vanleenenianus]|uniref:slipin family protein n=1 Tax=Trichomonascus vanleenenianus TaxID=2268995 RepID=UPI003EC979F1